MRSFWDAQSYAPVKRPSDALQLHETFLATLSPFDVPTFTEQRRNHGRNSKGSYAAVAKRIQRAGRHAPDWYTKEQRRYEQSFARKLNAITKASRSRKLADMKQRLSIVRSALNNSLFDFIKSATDAVRPPSLFVHGNPFRANPLRSIQRRAELLNEPYIRDDGQIHFHNLVAVEISL